ncbi:hypothetical protein PIIN_10312 [Serendipita indica DSM 11827]|uniref:Uncharacterized protein n=2 Tax=Serendipita indica (strain DSM 11827) TaxID=1109443 RepID=G4TYC4_SERID|nr:hypothetical protein PIIN_10312 [Serendipita indica DSM 11827]
MPQTDIVYKLPVEIWEQVFNYLCHRSFVQGDTGGLQEHISRSLVRYFRDILQPARNQLAIIECQPTVIVTTIAGHPAWEAERLEGLNPYPSYDKTIGSVVNWPSAWLTQSWPLLQSLVLDPNFPFNPIPILSRAPNLRLLSCRLETTRAENGNIYPLLHHPQLKRLTHLSLCLNDWQLINSPLPKLILPFLIVFQLRFQTFDRSSGTGTALLNLIPWKLPILRTFSLQGKIDMATHHQLQPFLDRHASIVVNFVNNLTSLSHRKTLYMMLLHFYRLQVYSVDVDCILREDICVSQSTSPEMQRESPTLLLTAARRIVPNFNTLTRVMLGESWRNIRHMHNQPDRSDVDFKDKLMALLVGFQKYGIVVVDIHGVKMPRGSSDWLEK